MRGRQEFAVEPQAVVGDQGSVADPAGETAQDFFRSRRVPDMVVADARVAGDE